jgi:hypothetical protein
MAGVRTELILVNELQTSPTSDDVVLVNCPTIENISVPITLQISDVRTPGEGSGSYTKTTTIPGTPEVDKFFESVYDVNVALQYFNPNLKVRAYYYVDGIQNFEGHLQIIKILVDEVNKNHYYEVNIIGEVITLFTKIKNLLVEDLNFSSYSHNLSYANIVASWTTPLFSSGIGSGVVYGLIDWGTNNSNLYNVRPQDFKPALFYREVLQKIFLAQGYTWTSTFLDSTDFKRKAFTACNFLNVSNTIENNNKFLATAGGSQTFTETSTGTIGVDKVTWVIPTIGNVAEFPNETYDTGNIYNNAGFVFTVPNTAKYNLSANLNLSFVIKRNGVDVNSSMTVYQASGIHIKLYNSFTSTVEAIGDLNIQGNQGDLGTNTYNGGVSLNNVTLTAGHLYYVLINVSTLAAQYTAAVAGATWTIVTTVNSSSNFSAQLASLDPFENQTVTINDILPLNYKQSDFISDLVKEFNLFVKPDKANPNNLIIEPRPDFYSTQPISWENKHDWSSKVEVIPLGELDFNVLKARYSEDADFYNKLYQDEYKEPYGSYTKIIQNDFIKNERVIQPSYAATPYAVNLPSNVVLPQILKKDNNVVGTIKPKIRMLHWSGLITLPAGASWVFKYNNGANQVVYTQQPHIGSADTPYGPTLDLSWGVPKRVYFSYPNQTWTTNNLYNKYYSQYFNQITDKNSKLIRTKFYLTANDIHAFDFQKPIFTVINGQQGYYLVNKIEEYNPLVSETTTVELLKLIDYAVFVPDAITIDPGPGGDSSTSGAKVMGGNYVQGPDNTNVGQDSMVSGGSGNYISNSAQSAELFNGTDVVVNNVSNFMGVNLTKTSEVSSNLINLQDKVKVYSDGHGALGPRVLRVTSDFTIDGKYSIYEIDLDSTGVAITCTWDVYTYPIQVEFKIVSNTGSYAFYIDDNNSPVTTIDGNAMPYTTGMATNDAKIIYSNGTTLKTIATNGSGGGGGPSSWGSITGTISSQTDLMSAISLRI